MPPAASMTLLTTFLDFTDTGILDHFFERYLADAALRPPLPRDQLILFATRLDDALPPDVLKLRQEIAQAHALILGTPEYHGSFSGVLKNALDWLDGSELQGKMIGLVGVAGGAADRAARGASN